MKYETLEDAEQRNMLTEQLRNVEREHFRLSTVNPTGETPGMPGTAAPNADVKDRLDRLEAEAERLRGEVAKLEGKS